MNDDPSIICTCGYHEKPPRLIHITACCSPCGVCKKRIKNGMAAAQAKTCAAAAR